MKLKNKSILLSILLWLPFTIFANPTSWQVYKNSACGYQINLPAKDIVTLKSVADLKKDFYLDPLKPITDLKMDYRCLTKIALPIEANTNLTGKYLFILRLNQWPVQNKANWNRVNIGDQSFLHGQIADAAMCHNFNYDYYLTKRNHQYHVLVFLFTSHCFGVSSLDRTRFDMKRESLDFSKILTSFRAS